MCFGKISIPSKLYFAIADNPAYDHEEVIGEEDEDDDDEEEGEDHFQKDSDDHGIYTWTDYHGLADDKSKSSKSNHPIIKPSDSQIRRSTLLSTFSIPFKFLPRL